MEKRNNFNRMMAAFMALVITVTYTPAPVSVYAKELDNIVTEQEEPEVITIDQGEDVLEEDEIITAEPEGLEDIIIEPMEDESTLAPETEIYEPEVSENIILEPETDGTIIDIDIESEISPEYAEGVTSWKGLQELINDAAYGDTITLSSDIVCDNGKSIKVDGDDVKNITIDLNGHKMDRNRTSSDGDGHVINVKDKATLILKDSVGTGILTGGYATDGGGIKIEKDSTCIIDGNVTISGNKASKDGGGIYAWGTLSMNGGIIAGNEAEDEGGGIYVEYTGKLELSNANITDNRSDDDGGGLNVHLATDGSITGCTIKGNRSGTDGGGLKLNSDKKTLTVSNTEISGNTAADQGGGINVDSGTLVMEGGFIKDNTAVDGGGIYNDNSTIRFNNVTITGNNTIKYAGAGINNKGNATVTSCRISKNTSVLGGAGIYTEKVINIENCIIDENTSQSHGGGICSDNGGRAVLSANKINKNTGIQAGGGIYVGSKGSVDINGVNTMTENAGSDIYLVTGRKLNITGPLSDGNNKSKFRMVFEASSGVFTEGFSEHNAGEDPVDYFVTEIGYSIVLDDSGEARFISSLWGRLQHDIDTASENAVINLDADYKAHPDDDTLIFPKDKTLTLNLNGHTLDRNLKSYKENGETITVSGNLTIIDTSEDGGGKICGGFGAGGGVLVKDGGRFILENGSITGNNGNTGGGGIRVNNGGNVTIKAGKVENNNAPDGGGIYSEGAVEIKETGAINSNNAAGKGGGIYMAGGQINNLAGISANRADIGGGVYIAGGSLNLNGGSITSNNASTEAGGIWHGSSGTSSVLNVKGAATVSGNTSIIGKNILLKGGSVINVAGNLDADASFDVTTDTTAAPITGDLGDNVSETDALRIFTYEGRNGRLEVRSEPDGKRIYLKNVEGNSVSNWEGLQSAINNAKDGDIITLSNNIVCNNDDSIKVDNRKVIVDLNGYKMDRKRSSSTDDGHVFNVKNHGELTLRDSAGTGVLTGGNATDGGGIKIEKDSTCIIEGGTIKGNKAKKDGAGIYVWGTLNMTGGSVINNETGGEGGGIYVEDTGTIDLDNVIIAGNQSVLNPPNGNGGGGGLKIHLKNDGSIKNCIIADNYAKKREDRDRYFPGYGGGLDLDAKGKTLTIENTVIRGNKADNDAGGIYLNSGTIHMSGGELSGNSGDDAGAIMVTSDTTFTAENVRFSDNDSRSESGGGVNNKGTTQLTDCTFTNNRSSKDSGGAVYNKSHITLTRCTFTGNRAGTQGGAVFSKDDANIVNCTFDSNTAAQGGGIYQADNKMIILSVNMIKNKAKSSDDLQGNGGAIYVKDGDTLVEGGNITDNSAQLYGGGIFVDEELKIKGDLKVSNNKNDNVYLHDKEKLNISGDIQGAIVYVSLEDDCGTFTKNLKMIDPEIDPANVFFSDHGYTVRKDGNGEGQLVDTEWPGLQKLINDTVANTEPGAEPVLIIDRDWKGSGNDKMLSLPAGKRLVIDLNGHTINMNRSSKDKDGHVFIVGDGCSLTIRDSSDAKTGTITGGWAEKGGAINLQTGAACTIESGNVTGNKADKGGAVYVHGGSELTVTGGSINDNEAVRGGGIYLEDEDADTAKAVAAGGIITGNTATVEAGGIFAGKRGELSVSGTPFVKGNEGAAGKNILLGAGNVLKIAGILTKGDDSSVGAKIDISAKSSASTGGSSAKLTDGLTTSGSVNDADKIFTYNEKSYETALEIEDGELRHKAISAEAWVGDWKALQDFVNDSKNNGKTVALISDIDASGEDYSIKVDGDNVKVITIDLNGHKMDRKRSSSSGDGHVINVKDGATLTITDSIGTGIITGGNTNDEGGGIKIEKNSTCIIEGGTVTGNRSEEKDGFFSDSNGDGGGIFVKGRLIMKGGSVVGNYAEDTGGGIHCTDSGTFDIDNALISGNTSKNDGGGFIVHLGSDAIIKNSRVTGNRSETEDGGGMRVEAGNKTLTVKDTEMSGNRAENNGGGMVIYAGRVVMENGKISGNISEDGGGVYNDGGTIEFTGVEISANTSSKKGGVGINNRNSATLIDCNIIGNTGEADGGGIYTTNDMTIIGGSISANSVKEDGGGIYVKGGNIRITGTSIGLNRAGKDGGAIFTDSDIELKDCTLKENNANVSGGAIRVRDCSVTLDNCSIQDNSCTDYGGGIYIDEGKAKLTVKGGRMTWNMSGLSGSGIYVCDGTDDVYISGNAEISDNLGGSDIYLKKGKRLTVTGPLFAGEGDSAVYARIGVATEEGLDTAFTIDYKKYNEGIEPSLVFFSNDMHEVYLKDDKEAAFKKSSKKEEEANPFIPKSSQMESNWQKLKGNDWMSGLSGERYLNEVNLPGTHDSGTANIHGNTSTSYAAWILKGLITISYPLGGLISYFSDDVYTAITDGFARCQRRYVDEQLQDGIRKFDFRVNTYHADNMSRSDNGKDLWIMHGKDKMMGTYYAMDHNDDPLTLAKVFDWIKEFLRENPTETVIIDIDPQGIDLDEDEARNRLRKHIRALSQEINPSTGEPYLYTEDGDYTKGLTRYPQLKECRGKIIYGLNRSAGIKNGVKDVFGSFHDDAKTKIKNLKDFYAQYGYDELPKDAKKAAFDYYMVAGTNGTNEPKDTPLDIADKVLPVLFGDGGLLTDRVGKFIGLVNMDGENTKVARQVWVTNFFDGIEYRTVTVKSGENDTTPKKYTVLKNTPITFPECIYDDPDQNGNYFQYWKSADKCYYPDDPFTVTDDVTFTAVWETSDSSSIRAVWNDGDNADGTRPTWLSVTFTKEGTEPEEKGDVILRASDNNWRTNIEYKVKGVTLTPPEGYEYNIKGTTIYLTHTPEKTVHVSGSIIWNDRDNNEGTRPEEVILELYANGVVVKRPTVKADDNWNYDLGDLQLYDHDGEKNKVTKITYTLKQKDKEGKEDIEGYSTYISGLNTSGAEQGFEVINTLISSGRLLEGIIIWADEDIDNAKRPDSVSVNLLKEGSVVSSNNVTKNADDDWLFAFALDKDTSISSYSVSENKIDGYTSTISKTDRDGDGEVDGVVVINKHENHQHAIKEISEISKEATCDKPGERLTCTICKECGEIVSKNTETIPALGHDWGKWMTKRTATETATGLEVRECKRCDHVENREVAKKGHVHDPEPVEGKAATCTKSGTRSYYHCAGCGLDFLDTKDPEKTKIDIKKGEAVIPALGHDWGEWKRVKEPSYTENGEDAHTCKKCGVTETRTVNKKDPKEDPKAASYSVMAGNNQKWYKGSKNTLDFTFKRSVDDQTTFSHFTGIKIDGDKVAESNYTKAAGSVIIRLNPDYLSGLKAGTHTLIAEFDDGSANAAFAIESSNVKDSGGLIDNSGNSGSGSGSSGNSNSGSSSGSSSSDSSSSSGSSGGNDIIPIGTANNSNANTGLNTINSTINGVNTAGESEKGGNRSVPVTGDTANVIIWLAIMLASFIIMILVFRSGRKRHR